MIRCGGRFSSSELLTMISFLSSPESAWAVWNSDHNKICNLLIISLGTYNRGGVHHLPPTALCCDIIVEGIATIFNIKA